MNTTFTNQQIKNAELPSATAIQFEPLHSKYKNVVVITTVILMLCIVSIGACGFYLPVKEEALVSEYKVTLFVISVVWAIIMAFFRIAGVNKKGYAVREHDIIYKTGLLSQKQITIPFNRVQHVEIYEGFLLRLFGLARIEFFTAGGNWGDLKIPGLLINEADKIKAFVIEQVLPPTKVDQLNPVTEHLNTEV